VLYLENASRDTSDAYIADGLTEEIITRLGQVGRLQVASRFAIRRYRGQSLDDAAAIGRSLGVGNLVSGTVRRVGGRVLVNVELLRASNGMQLWTERYDRSDADLIGLEQDIAVAVATAIAGRLAPGERALVSARPTRDPVAYDRFLRGNFDLAQRTPLAEARAIEEYRQALAADPRFVPAQARIAYVYGLMLDYGWTLPGISRDSMLALGFAAADRTLAMDPRSSDGWMARGTLLARRDERTYAGAIPAAERSIALDARNAEAWHQYGNLLVRLRRDSLGTAALLRALALEQGRPITLLVLGAGRAYMRDLPGAMRWLDSALAIDPEFAYGYALRSVYRMDLGRLDDARSDAETAVRLGWSPLAGHTARVIVAARAGDTLTARAALDSVRAGVARLGVLDWRNRVYAARAWVALGDLDGALDCLEHVEPRGLSLGQSLRLPDFDVLRSSPRFQRLVAQTQLPETR
jgi:TolB-like protein